MTLRTLSLAGALALLLAAPGVGRAQDEAIEQARSAAKQWLALFDAQQYDDTWRTAGELLQAAVSQEEWSKRWSVTLGPLGRVVSRAVRSSEYSTRLPGAPEGEYVVVGFDTTFEREQVAFEEVVLRKEAGAWKVSGYRIK